MTWLILKSIAAKLATFIAENYRVIAFILLLALTYYYKSCYDSVQRDYERFRANVASAAEVRKAENVQLAKYAKQAVEAVTLHHTEQLEAIKHDYEKRNKVNVGTIANLRDRLRDQIKDSYFRVPESTSDTIINTESERECYAAYSSLESACKITTLDFNAIRSWADTVCQTVGCEESR